MRLVLNVCNGYTWIQNKSQEFQNVLTLSCFHVLAMASGSYCEGMKYDQYVRIISTLISCCCCGNQPFNVKLNFSEEQK